MKRVLSIGGGGIKVVGPAKFISLLKENNINYNFDVYVGTSSGSILASLYAFGFEPEEACQIFHDASKKIFSKRNNLFKRIFKNHFSLYDNSHIKKICEDIFKDAPLYPEKPLFITRYNIDNKIGEIKQIINIEECIEYILCSISAPFYFDPIKIGSTSFIDGGFFANNPLIAFADHVKDNGIVFNSNDVEYCLKELDVFSFEHRIGLSKTLYKDQKWYDEMILTLVTSKFSGHSKLVSDFAENTFGSFKEYSVFTNCALDDISKVNYIQKEWIKTFNQEFNR